jgi:hypothetical protein
MEKTTSIFSLATKHRSSYFLTAIFFLKILCIRSDYNVKAAAAHHDNPSSTKKQHLSNEEHPSQQQPKPSLPLDNPAFLVTIPRNMTSVATCDGSDKDEVPIEINIWTDDNPLETYWDLRNITSYDDPFFGDLLHSVKEGDYQIQSHEYRHTYCVERNGCYKFIIYDEECTGMNDGGDGGFEVLFDGDVILDEGGEDFGWSFESNLFGDGCASLMTPPSCDGSNDEEVPIEINISTDNGPWETSWDLQNITSDNGSIEGEVLFSAPVDAYHTENHEYNHKYCVKRNGCYRFIINDYYGNGMNDGDNGGFEVLFDDDVVSTGGGNFGLKYESVFFGDGCGVHDVGSYGGKLTL